MKEIKREKVQYYTVYQATDGTEFNNIDECAEYEASAKGVVRQKLWKLVVDDTYNECSLFEAGCEDDRLLIVKMETPEDRDTVLQAYFLDNPWVLKEDASKWKTRAIGFINKAFEEKDYLILGLNCDDDLYVVTTRNTIIERLNNLGKPKETPDEKH